MKWQIAMAFAGLLLAGCNPIDRDYEASKRCHARGITAGTPQYDSCMEEEKTRQLLEEQRREYDQMRQEREDIRRKGYLDY